MLKKNDEQKQECKMSSEYQRTANDFFSFAHHLFVRSLRNANVVTLLEPT